MGASFRQGVPESRHTDVTSHRIAIHGHWTPAIPAGVTDHSGL